MLRNLLLASITESPQLPQSLWRARPRHLQKCLPSQVGNSICNKRCSPPGLRSFASASVVEIQRRLIEDILKAATNNSLREECHTNGDTSPTSTIRQQCAEIAQQISEMQELLFVAHSEKDGELANECEQMLSDLWQHGAIEIMDAALQMPMAEGHCFLEVHSGEGGIDSMDWCQMLGDMYTSWASSQGFTAERVSSVAGEVAGFRSQTLHIAGNTAYGLLAPEVGVHRVIRHSPFDRRGRRHTSFAVVVVLPDKLYREGKNSIADIPKSDLRIETMRSSGPGGQSVNMSETAVRLTHVPTGICVKCQKVGSQIENMKTAMKWLHAKLQALEETKQRKQRALCYASAPEPSAASEQRVRTYTLHPRELVKDI